MTWVMMTDGDVEHNNHQDYLLSLAWIELIDDSMDQFCSVVDEAYKTSFEREYSGFAVMGGYLLERKCIREMYGFIVCLFPFVYSMLTLNALFTCPHGEQVSFSCFMNFKNPCTNHCDLVKHNEDFSDKDSDGIYITLQWQHII
jgi:hypothetical protein